MRGRTVREVSGWAPRAGVLWSAVRTLCLTTLVAVLIGIGEDRSRGAAVQRIAFVGQGGIRIMNADGSGNRLVTPGVNFDWSPDGKHLVDVRPGFTLLVVPVDGGSTRRIGRGLQADWSPDGTKLAFIRGVAVHVIGADGKGLRRRLTSPSDSARDSEPEWSPDGRRIAWVRKFESADNDVNRAFVMNADGTRQRRITTTADPYSVSWSPDSRMLLCSCWAYDNYDIVVIPADGSPVRNLTPEYANDSDPSWSPDGKRVVFTRQDGPGADEEIHVVGRGGSGRRRLTRAPGFDGDTAWSPDGRRLAFISERDGRSFDIYVMSADGRRPTNLTRGGAGARILPGRPGDSRAAVTTLPNLRASNQSPHSAR